MAEVGGEHRCIRQILLSPPKFDMTPPAFPAMVDDLREQNVKELPIADYRLAVIGKGKGHTPFAGQKAFYLHHRNQGQQLLTTVFLIKALGGDWQNGTNVAARSTP